MRVKRDILTGLLILVILFVSASSNSYSWVRPPILTDITGNSSFGEMYLYNTTGQTVAIPFFDVYYNVTILTAGHLKDVTFLNSRLIINNSGMYDLDYHISFSGGANSDYGIAIYVNENNSRDCYARRKLGAGGDVGNAGGTCLLNLSAGDHINIRIEDEVNPSQDVNLYTVNVNLHNIKSTQNVLLQNITINGTESWWNRTIGFLTQRFFGDVINTTANIRPYLDEYLSVGTPLFRFNQSWIEQRNTGLLDDKDNNKIVLNSSRIVTTTSSFFDIYDSTTYAFIEENVTTRDVYIKRNIEYGNSFDAQRTNNTEMWELRINVTSPEIAGNDDHNIEKYILNNVTRHQIHYTGVRKDQFAGRTTNFVVDSGGFAPDVWFETFDMPIPDNNYSIGYYPSYTYFECEEQFGWIYTECHIDPYSKTTLGFNGQVQYHVYTVFGLLPLGNTISTFGLLGLTGCALPIQLDPAVWSCNWVMRRNDQMEEYRVPQWI